MRSGLDEASWAAVVAETGLDTAASPLRPLGEHAAPVDAPQATHVEAAALALGRADVGISLLSGTNHSGVIAQLGANTSVLGVALRAVLSGVGGAEGPVAVPGVELGAGHAGAMVEEVMRLVPPGGEVRDLPDGSVGLEREDALVMARTAVADEPVAAAAARRSGLDEVPEVIRAVARGTTASVTLTISTSAARLYAVRQWLLTDAGWVSLTMLGRRVVHAPRSRDELAAELTALLAGAWDSALAARGRVS